MTSVFRTFTYSALWLVVVFCPLQAEIQINEAMLLEIESKYNHFARVRIESWLTLMNTSENVVLDDQAKLELVNEFFNSNTQFIDDIALWGENDYWATPLEMLAIGAGDCEDYAIAKYFALKELGVDESKLRITYVKAINLNQAHMVLTYFKTPRSMPLVLDNLIMEIKPAAQRTDLIPVYSFNGEGLWLAKARGEGRLVGESSRISLWDELVKRMQAQLESPNSLPANIINN